MVMNFAGDGDRVEFKLTVEHSRERCTGLAARRAGGMLRVGRPRARDRDWGSLCQVRQ